MTNIDKIKALFAGIAAGDAASATRHLDPAHYVEHDPHVGDGVAGVRRHIEEIASGGHRLDLVRFIEDGDVGVTQADGRVRDDGVFFDVFRFEDGLVVEHWGFAAPPGPPNRSGHTQVDGPVKAGRKEDTAATEAFARDYYQTFHIAGRHDLADRYFAGSPMVRHEPGVADGVDSFLRDLAMLTRDRTIDEIRLILGEGDLVFIAALGTHQGESCAYVDLYRVHDGRIMEHWGFAQPIPPVEARKNGNAPL